MGTFSKIKKYSKSSSIIDEKIKTFNDELYKTLLREGPTNSTSGIYIVEPEKDTTVTVNPEPVLDLSADAANQSGTDTTGIFDEFGNSILIDPPGTWQIQDGPTSDPSASLGPMISYYDSASNTTYLGYVRQSDRSMVNLGRITGQMSTWDGASNFTSYGQLTLSQAQWYQAEHNGGRVGNYRVFYSGKSDNTDPYHRVFGKMINTPKGAGSNPWVVYTSNPIKSDQQITVKFYYDGGSLYSGARPPIFYDTNTGLPNGISAVDTVDFTVPAGDGVQLQQGQNGGGFDINGIGLKWRYLRGPENPYGHDEPDGDPNGVSSWYHPDDYFVWYMTINGKDYPLPPGLNGMAAAIGIPGGFGGWNRGNANSKDGSGERTIPGKIPPKKGGFDPNILPGSAKDKKKSDWDKYLESLPPGVRDDILKGGKTSSHLGDLGIMGLSAAAAAAILKGGGPLADAITGKPPGPYVGQAPRPPRITSTSKEIWNTHTGRYDVVKNTDPGWDWAQRALKDTGPNSFDHYAKTGEMPSGLKGWRPQQGFDPTRPASKGGPGSMPTPQVMTPGGVAAAAGGAAAGAAVGTGIANVTKVVRGSNNKKTQKNSYEIRGTLLKESQRKIIKNIKKPYKLPEIPKEKYKFNFSHKVRSVGHDLMKQAEVPSSFKRAEERMWGRHEKYMNARMSQERKNQVLDFVGTSDHAWEWMMEKNQKNSKNVMYGNFDIKKYMGIESDKVKGNIIRIEQTNDNDALFYFQDENGNKSVMLQSDFDGILNETRLSESEMDEKEDDYTDNLYRKSLKKLGYKFDYTDKPAKKGYPNDPPPEMINGWHPKFGDRADYYNKLDPQSADFMPSTENPEIDAKVEKSKTKKFKVKEESKINWKKDISKHKKHYMEGKVVQEGMTSSGVFSTTLPATGDTDLTSLSGGDSSIYYSLGQGDSYGSYGQLPSTRISNSGTGSGINGGFNVGSNYLAFNGKDSNTVRVATLNPVDTSTVDSISITGLRGNNSNGGVTPASDLVLIYYNIDTEEFGEITVMSSSGPTSLTKQSFSLPKEAQGKNVQFYFYDITSDGHGYDGKQFIGKTLSVSGISNYPLTSSYSNILDFYINVPYNQIINRDPQSIQPSWYSMGRFFWDNILRSTIGWGTNVDIQGPPGPISGGTKYWSTSTEPPAGLGYMTVADYIYIGQQIYLQFSGAATYGISNISFQRRAPMNVFVPLNSPEATAFIRTEPNLSNLSPQEKQQKLKEMLEASDEYLEKILGPEFPGTGAVPPGESSETPGVEITSDQDTQIAQNWPSIKDAKPSQTTPIAPVWAPGEPLHPGQRPYTGPTPSGPPVRLAHYEPKGQLISERKKLKSPEEVLGKIPGYYDGKPAPLGFPVEKPPEMVNGMHPDLVDGKKVANRFNRMDPESAKAMPSTGNPHIDKKVKAAQKKPK